MLILAVVEVDLVRSNDRLDDPGIAGIQRLSVLQLRHRIARRHRLVAARHEDPSFASLEPDAVRKIAADDHADAVRIQRFSLEWAMNIPESTLGKFSRTPDLDRTRVFRVHPPVRAVDVMRSPAGDHPRAELLASQPSRPVVTSLGMYAFLGVGHDGRRAKPH